MERGQKNGRKGHCEYKNIKGNRGEGRREAEIKEQQGSRGRGTRRVEGRGTRSISTTRQTV